MVTIGAAVAMAAVGAGTGVGAMVGVTGDGVAIVAGTAMAGTAGCPSRTWTRR